MADEKMKEKYSSFIADVSEILGLGKPVDILKLCATTDRFFRPLQEQIQIDAEQIRALQKQNGELTDELKALRESTKDYGAGCYENGLKNGKRAAEKDIERQGELLEKATIIIKEFTSLLQNPRTALDTKTVTNKAEQFLSEVEE